MSGPGSVEIRRRLPAPIAEVFRWWTEPERVREWMSPTGSVEAEVDLRVGGAFRIVMSGHGQVIEHVGQYLEIDAPRRLVFTWASVFTGAEPSLVTVELEPEGDGATQLRIVHAQLPDDAAASHRDGWGAMADRLAGRLGKEAEIKGGR
jgi:uncharacterized protein YndB with AHSA1/START domain